AASVVCAVGTIPLSPPESTVLLVLTPAAFLFVLREALAGYLMARGRIVVVETSLATYQVGYNAAAIMLALAGLATPTRIAGVQVALLFMAVLLLVQPWRHEVHEPSGTRQGLPIRRMLLFALPLLMASVSWTVLERSDVLLLGIIKGSGAVGVYAPVLRIE